MSCFAPTFFFWWTCFVPTKTCHTRYLLLLFFQWLWWFYGLRKVINHFFFLTRVIFNYQSQGKTENVRHLYLQSLSSLYPSTLGFLPKMHKTCLFKMTLYFLLIILKYSHEKSQSLSLVPNYTLKFHCIMSTSYFWSRYNLFFFFFFFKFKISLSIKSNMIKCKEYY